jgi:hypothetical protein
MDMRSVCRVLAIAGAGIVLGALFLHWYKTTTNVLGSPGSFTRSGWLAFTGADIALFAFAGAAIVLVLNSFFFSYRAVMAAIGILGIAAFALTTVKIASPPESVTLSGAEKSFTEAGLRGTLQASTSTDVGAYFALVGSAILAAAGLMGAFEPTVETRP